MDQTTLAKNHPMMMLTTQLNAHGCLLALGSFIAFTNLAYAQSFEGLGDLAGGTFSSKALGISADGSTVVGASESASGLEAARWRQGSWTGLGDLAGGAFRSSAWTCNSDGTIVVGMARDGTCDRAVRWDDTMLSILPQVAGYSGGSVASGITADGSVISGYNTDGQIWGWSKATGFRHENSITTALPDGSGGLDSACGHGGPNDAGQITAGRVKNGTSSYQACYWDQTTLHILPGLAGGSGYSHCYAVSGDGLTIVGESDSAASTVGLLRAEACIWQAGIPIALGDLPGGNFISTARDCTTDGALVVGTGETVNGQEAFLWDSTTGLRRLQDVMLNDYGLDTTGWTLVHAHAITPDGSAIIGEGINPQGQAEGWIARLQSPPHGAPYCFGDGSGAACPCGANGSSGEGCLNTTTTHGATLNATGIASISNDTLQLDVAGVPGAKPGLLLKGDNQVSIPAGDGLLCTAGNSLRSQVQLTAGGATTFTEFNVGGAGSGAPLGSVANLGTPTNYQFWYRDPSNTCTGAGFNFTNGWTVTWTP